jgi:hypothetical protein
MPKKDQLVPVFIPSLAECLAHAEKVKGSPLTETEVVRIRDKAVCMMMSSEMARHMDDERGFRDVHPETCWSDWHRLRVQMTGNGYLPKIVLCLLGGPDFPEQCATIFKEDGIDHEHEFRGHDDRMVRAFEASASPVEPSLTKQDYARIGAHASVLYLLSKNFTAGDAPQVSQELLRLGSRLLQGGGIAMKCESSGIAHGQKRWIALAQKTKQGFTQECWSALFAAFVQMPLQSEEEDLHTCGMHLLGKPDLIVQNALLPVPDAIELFQRFAMYLLGECKEGEFGSGHTFHFTKSSPRFRVVWEACSGYEEDEFFFNPFGRWRFTNAKR